MEDCRLIWLQHKLEKLSEDVVLIEAVDQVSEHLLVRGERGELSPNQVQDFPILLVVEFRLDKSHASDFVGLLRGHKRLSLR